MYIGDSWAAEIEADGMANGWHFNLLNDKSGFVGWDKDVCQS